MSVTKVVLENNTPDLIRIPVTEEVQKELRLKEAWFALEPRKRVRGILKNGGRKIMPEWCLDVLRETFPQVHIWINRKRLMVK